MEMAARNFHPVQPIVTAVETVGKNPRSKTRTKYPGAENYNKIYKKLTTKGKTSSKNPRRNPTGRKTKKSQIEVEAPEKAHPPQRPLTIHGYANHRPQPRTKVIVPEQYRPGPRG